MSELATRTGLVVVVSHGAAMRVLDCRLGGPGERYANLSGMFISDKLDFLGRIDDFSG
jgi:broad specificity phosphatase PhoE